MNNSYKVNENNVFMKSDEVKSIFDKLMELIDNRLVTSLSIKIETLNEELYSTSNNPIQSYKNICTFIDTYAIYDEDAGTGGWMNNQQFVIFVSKLKDIIYEELNIEIYKDVSPDELYASDIREVFDKFNLPYRVRYIKASSIPYIIDKK